MTYLEYFSVFLSIMEDVVIPDHEALTSGGMLILALFTAKFSGSSDNNG